MSTAVLRRETWLANPRLLAALLAAYLAVHFALRLALNPTLTLDDAEQALFTQHWAWSYQLRQPPLFTWLLLPVAELVGTGVVAISLLRYALYGLYFVVFHMAARRWIGDDRLAALATAGNLLIYMIAFYAHYNLSNTTLLAVMVAATLYVLARLAERRSAQGYAALGACFGLGLLAKWNFGFMIAGLIAALLAERAMRPIVLDRRFLLTIAVAAALIAPELLWMWGIEHAAYVEVAASTLAPHYEAEPGSLEHVLAGTGRLAFALLAFPQPFAVIFLCLFAPQLAGAWRARKAAPLDPGLRVLVLAMAVAAALYWLLIPLTGAGDFRDRWMLPVLGALPIVLFAWIRRFAPSPRAIRAYVALVLIASIAALGARAGRYLLGADHCRKCLELVRFEELAKGARKAGFSRGSILAVGGRIGGNFRVAFPESRVVDATKPPVLWAPLREPGRTGECLVVWRAGEGSAADDMPKRLAAALDRLAGAARPPPVGRGSLEAGMVGSDIRRYRLAYRLYAPGPGACR